MNSPVPRIQPFFLYGALRSGTTLLRLILNQHSEVHSLEESDFLFDYIHSSPDTPDGFVHDRSGIENDVFFRLYGIDMPDGQGVDLTKALVQAIAKKIPGSTPCLDIHRHVSLAATQFPDAKFIHLLRDPRDVARSSVGMGWSGHSYYGVDHWIGTEADWDIANLPPERALTVRFEDLIVDLNSGLREICEFLGLPFDDGMLDYHKHATYDPPDPSIAYKWKKKERSRDIALIEGRAADLMLDRGYELSGDPATPGAIEKIGLSIQHRLNRWRFNLRRYGLKLFVGHHLAKLFRLRGLEQRLAVEQEKIRIRNFK